MSKKRSAQLQQTDYISVIIIGIFKIFLFASR